MLPVKQEKKRTGLLSTFRRTLARYEQQKDTATRLGFIIDATGSRSGNWEQAQGAQRRMFAATKAVRNLRIRLVHYGGTNITDHGWLASAKALWLAMAPVRCAGGQTQILPSLRLFLADDSKKAKAVIIVGDCFEEDFEEALALVREFRERGIRLFFFDDSRRDDCLWEFRELAGAADGVYARLGDTLPLEEFLEAIAVHAAGGRQALQALPDTAAKQLLLAHLPRDGNQQS